MTRRRVLHGPFIHIGRVSVAIFALATVLVPGSTTPAAARPGNWFSEPYFWYGANPCITGACLADSSTHNWSHSLGPKLLTATFDTLYSSYDTTDIRVVLSPNNHHSTTVDVHYEVGDPDDPEALAVYRCVVRADNERCDHAHVTYDGAQLSALYWANSRERLKGIACHETGHSLGLLHGDEGVPALSNTDHRTLHCMAKPSFGFDHHVGQHNLVHLNSHY